MTFLDSVKASLSSRGIEFSSFCDMSNRAEATIMNMYGAVFLSDYLFSLIEPVIPDLAAAMPIPFPGNVAVRESIRAALASTRIKFPGKCIFPDEQAVTDFQSSVASAKETVGGVTIELQAKAMGALKKAETEAKDASLTITPNGDATAARRSYADTQKFWDKRITSGIAHWKVRKNSKGENLTQAEADALNSLKGTAQINKVLELEDRGFFFSTYHDKTILASVAAPGTSQHLFMLALDVKEHKDKRVRKILADNGWFQTVFKDHPHFTFLGMAESSLKSLGLQMKTDAGQEFWVP
ncbi:MAG: hypothetical protein R2747_19350 [Pyrinomonadaceae bacterium]